MSEASSSDSTSGSAPTRPSRAKRVTSRYVLQAPRQVDDVTCWVDVAEIEVPASTRRMTAVRKAVAAWGAAVPEEGVGVRLLAAQDAEPIPVRPKPPEPPQLEIG